MRLLIESRRLTIELASTKHRTVDHPGACTFVSDNKAQDSRIEELDTKSLQSPVDYETSIEALDTSVYHYTQLPRRKSIHRRIGRVFLRISKMCSGVQCDTYAYQYGCGISELPAIESTTESTVSFYEMPGSFPRVELESQDMPKSPSMQCAQPTPEHLQKYYKANQTATFRKAAPISVANLSKLPRLEVPQSQHCVPQLMSGHSLTPSPISPLTPEGSIGYGYKQSTKSQLYADAISPCTIPKQGQIFAHYESWGLPVQQTPVTPSTGSSYNLSYSTTPSSEYPPSAESSFQIWPQSQIWDQPPSYPQTNATVQYNQNAIYTAPTENNAWQRTFHDDVCDTHDSFVTLQNPDYQQNGFEFPQPIFSMPALQDCFGKQTQMNNLNMPSTRTRISPTFDEAPPAYSPVVPQQQPATSTLSKRYPPAVCQQCGKVFTGKFGSGNCKRHVQQIHASVFDRAIHMCKVCFKTYNRGDALRKHQWKKHRLEDARPNKRRDRGL